MKRETRDDIMIWSAVGMLFAGVGVSVAGFSVEPLGIIHDTVLWFFAQCLIWSGAVFGIPVYVRTKINSMIGNISEKEKTEVKRRVNNELDQVIALNISCMLFQQGHYLLFYLWQDWRQEWNLKTEIGVGNGIGLILWQH